MPRALFVMFYPERLGGAERFLWDVLRHLDRSRIEPAVLLLRPGPLEAELAGLGIPTTVVPVGQRRQVHRNIAAVVRLRRLLRSDPPAVIVNWTHEAQLYAGSAAALAGLRDRVVWWDHGFHRLDRLATAVPAAAIGASSHAALRAQEGRWPRRERFVVSPGVDEPAPRDPEAVAELRQSLGIPPGRLVLGVVGRLNPEKAQDRFVEALAMLRERGHDAHGLLVGGTAHDYLPRYASLIEQRVRELGLEDAVTFTGHVTDVGRYIEPMDVLVNLCAWEAFGLSIVEAMAHGVPVVAVGALGPSEIVVQGRSGVLIETNEPGVVADAIEPLLASSEARRALGEGGRERFRARYTSERMAHELEERLLRLAVAPVNTM